MIIPFPTRRTRPGAGPGVAVRSRPPLRLTRRGRVVVAVSVVVLSAMLAAVSLVAFVTAVR
ncbi:MAG TPA: hypothetical protein VIR27_06995 [Mycobacteriales bacterium]